MEDSKVFEAYYELPEGYQVQLMVMQGLPGGKPGKGARVTVFRSRIWIGHASEPEPITYRSHEHADLPVAIDACYSMWLASSRRAIHSPDALEATQRQVHLHFSGRESHDSVTYPL